VSSDRYDELRRTARVSTALRKSDGIHVRVVSRERPSCDAAAAEPSLEDAFLWVTCHSERERGIWPGGAGAIPLPGPLATARGNNA